jgi:hypothetical protein
MNTCNIKKGHSIWPEDNDFSGDNIFSLDENQLIRDIRATKRKEERNLFLEEEPESLPEEEPESLDEPLPGIKIVKYQDLERRDKMAYIINQLEKYKKNDL